MCSQERSGGSSVWKSSPTQKCSTNGRRRNSRRVQLKCDGTRWCTGGEVKGKLANGVGIQYSSHYLGTWCIQYYYRWCTHTSASSSRLNWSPHRFKWTRPFRRKTKSGFCACAITFQTQSYLHVVSLRCSDQEVEIFCLTLSSQPFHTLAYLLGLQLQLMDKCIPFLDTAGFVSVRRESRLPLWQPSLTSVAFHLVYSGHSLLSDNEVEVWSWPNSMQTSAQSLVSFVHCMLNEVTTFDGIL